MRPRPGETRAGCEPPSRQTLQIPRSPGPTDPGPRGIAAFPLRAPCVGALFLLCRLGRRRPLSVRAQRSWSWTPGGNCELESSAPPGFRFNPDPSTLALDDLLAEPQTDARTWDFASMQAFEHTEHPAGILRIDTDFVVPHRKQTSFPVSLRRDVDPRCFLAPVLDGVGNEVLEKLHQRNLFGYHGWQRIGSYCGATLCDGSLEVQ